MIAATTPPFLIARSPICQATAAAMEATTIRRTQARRSVKSFLILLISRFMFSGYLPSEKNANVGGADSRKSANRSPDSHRLRILATRM